MVAIPTNYKMGSGLAATIMGQQAGLEAEQQGLANLMKGMQMPAEALKGQEAAMLMQNPEYLQQKTANTMIELRNTYSAAEFQDTLNAANRVRIEMDAAAGDPAKEQAVAQKALTALKIDPSSEFYQFAMKQPRKALEMFIQGTEASMAGAGNKYQGEMAKQRLVGEQGMEQLKLKEAGDDRRAQLGANAQITSANKNMMVAQQAYAKDLRQELDGLNSNITRLEGKELDQAIRQEFFKRNKRQPTNAEIQQEKNTLKKDLITRRDGIQTELNDVRATISGNLGFKKSGSTPPPGNVPPPPSGYTPL